MKRKSENDKWSCCSKVSNVRTYYMYYNSNNYSDLDFEIISREKK